jgi:hypothetical protein
MDEASVHPETRSGDPFYAASRTRDEGTPHGCYEGWVYLGYEEDGEEHVEAVPCRKCRAAEDRS